MTSTATSPNTAIHWNFEPGHTAAEFRARHMMVTWVRGQYKNVAGSMTFDPDDFSKTKIDVTIDAAALATGEPNRDNHLRSADFLDVANHPTIEFHTTEVKTDGATSFRAIGDLTIRGVTRPVTFHVRYLGQWLTPWCENGVDLGPRLRAGFEANAKINRHDFGVSWNDVMDRGGVVVSDEIEIVLDAEAVNEAKAGG